MSASRESVDANQFVDIETFILHQNGFEPAKWHEQNLINGFDVFFF